MCVCVCVSCTTYNFSRAYEKKKNLGKLHKKAGDKQAHGLKISFIILLLLFKSFWYKPKKGQQNKNENIEPERTDLKNIVCWHWISIFLHGGVGMLSYWNTFVGKSTVKVME